LLIALEKVWQGATRLQGLPSLPVPLTQVRVDCAFEVAAAANTKRQTAKTCIVYVSFFMMMIILYQKASAPIGERRVWGFLKEEAL
jgi:hypothetical protein